ncbi:MotA/TolQ/ExbB proton channel family protein [uncultured Ferrimonas sp.]|uniref:MotA/TolQ/ExbB proton channel family protein n=1 Tax=uncultured Ferrimonas sp. TaxID=432640 RepID=UPI00260D4071|nr:MotA/TolQ/ExbB proton channel family protein [uncultured Ferrimonas sp.]
MAFIQHSIAQLGPMAWPLFICLSLSLIILLERTVLVLFTSGRRAPWLKRLECRQPLQIDVLQQQLASHSSLLCQGAAMLLSHAQQEKSLREEIAQVWLQKQRRRLSSGLRLLMVIGIISPMLGLLGTVLGLIDMFAAIGSVDGPVSPALLASGLGQAMYTTAAGLCIALPAIGGAHLLNLWAERQLAKMEHVLNHLNLWLAGIAPRSQQEMQA